MGARTGKRGSRSKKGAKSSTTGTNLSPIDELIGQIRTNLSGCKHTTAKERAELEKSFETAIKDATDLTYEEVNRAVSDTLKEVAYKKGWFFLGPPADFASTKNVVFHAKLVGSFLSSLARHFLNSGYSYDAATNSAQELCYSLMHPRTWASARNAAHHKSLPLHRTGFPFWIADPASGTPHADAMLDEYPARAGLFPDFGDFVVLKLSVKNGFEPRFADSCGYSLWRPGGWTKPTPSCPSTHSGFKEAVTDGVSLGHLTGHLLKITR